MFTRGHRNDPTRHSYATCMDFLTRFLDTFWSQIMPKSNFRIVGCLVVACDIGKNRTQFIIFKFYWGLLLLSIKPFLTTLQQKGNCMYFVYFAINPKLFTATIWAISSFQFGKLFQHKHKNFLWPIIKTNRFLINLMDK